MANTAEIIFTGICLFLRPQDVTQPPEAAVFMDGKTNLDGTPSAHPHEVFLVVDPVENEVTESGTVSKTTEVGPYGKTYYVYHLDNKLIKILSRAGEVTLSHNLDDPGHSVAHLGRVSPRWMIGGPRAEVDGLREEIRPSALKDVVNARLQLPSRGDLRVTFSDDDRWRFTPHVFGNATVEGTIPQEVTLHQTLIDDQLEFLIYKIDGDGAYEGTVTLKVRSGSGYSTELMALIANVPEHDLFPSDRCATEVDCKATPTDICCQDAHFSLYYKALKRPPGNPPLPNKFAVLPGLQDGVHLFRAGGANCGPAQQP